MHKNILICALSGREWIGGIYYIKNLLYSLSISDEAQNKYIYYLFVKKEVRNEFSEFVQIMKIKVIECDEFVRWDEQLILACTDYKIDVVLPMGGGGYTWLLKDRSLYWIPDFQEVYLPENFTDDVIKERKGLREYISNENKKLIVSSNDAYDTYKSLCPQNIQNAFVVHFTSYIKPIMEQVTDEFERQVMEKYGITYEYIFIANQFWKHKNHIVALRAMNLIINEKKTEIHLICTGFMSSYGKNDEYIDSLYKYIGDNKLGQYVHFLGIIERTEQLCIMKNAKLLVQPSRFEGWGCSVEDGKVMGKEMLLSDINVHKEQQYPKAKLFPQDDSVKLSELLLDSFPGAKKYDFEYGRKYTMQKAAKYSKELQNAIDSIEICNKENYLEKLERLRKEKLMYLFNGMPQHKICIYGVGNCTKKMLESCRKIFEDIEFVYSDSDEEKWGKEFAGGKIYSPNQLLDIGIKRIVISSIKYQEEIYRFLRGFAKNVEIVKIYASEKEKNEALWI